MGMRQTGLGSAFVWTLAIVVGCGGRAASLSPPGESGSASGSLSGTSGVASGSLAVASGGPSGYVSGGGTSGSEASDTGAMSASASGDEFSEADAAASDATAPDDFGDVDASVDADPFAVRPSPGCHAPPQPFQGPRGTWVRQPPNCDEDAQANCQAIPPGSTPPTNPMAGDPEWRGWWVWVPNTYDGTKPMQVAYNFAGSDDQDIFNAGNAGFNFNLDANAGAILVGLDYDTFTDVPLTYDGRDPLSNDVEFFPWLQNHIESELCVDMSHEYMAGYQTGEWVVQQLSCKFPTRIRASAGMAGCEPGTPANPGGSLPTCASNGPQAAFFVHDTTDSVAPYACILPGCSRMLKQNGCAVTDCSDPMEPSLTSPYRAPDGVTLPTGAECRQFNGCPADYPVVFCTTVGDWRYLSATNWGVDRLWWDWFVNRLR